MNLARALRQRAKAAGGKTAIHFQGSTISYAELWHAVKIVARYLQSKGVRIGDRVGLCMAEHPQHLAAHFAVARLGAVIVPMDPLWSDPEKTAVSSIFDCKFVLDDSCRITPVGSGSLLEWVPATTDVLVSLSTGANGAVLTHENLYQRFISQWQSIGYGEDDGFATLTPFYSGAARTFAMSLLCAGGTVHIAPPTLTPHEVVAALRHPAVTATCMTPTLLRGLIDLHASGSPPLLENLEYLLVSGEPLPAEDAHQAIATVCANIYRYYASSEGGGIAVLLPHEFRDYAGTVGKPTYRTDVEIVDENDEPTADAGRLRYRGPGVSTRFIDTQGMATRSNDDGWFYPGDRARWTDGGHLQLIEETHHA